jgi:hypothetical protein
MECHVYFFVSSSFICCCRYEIWERLPILASMLIFCICCCPIPHELNSAVGWWSTMARNCMTVVIVINFWWLVIYLILPDSERTFRTTQKIIYLCFAMSLQRSWLKAPAISFDTGCKKFNFTDSENTTSIRHTMSRAHLACSSSF